MPAPVGSRRLAIKPPKEQKTPFKTRLMQITAVIIILVMLLSSFMVLFTG